MFSRGGHVWKNVVYSCGCPCAYDGADCNLQPYQFFLTVGLIFEDAPVFFPQYIELFDNVFAVFFYKAFFLLFFSFLEMFRRRVRRR